MTDYQLRSSLSTENDSQSTEKDRHIGRIDKFVTSYIACVLQVHDQFIFKSIETCLAEPLNQPGTIKYCSTENKYIALHSKRLICKSGAIDYWNLHL